MTPTLSAAWADKPTVPETVAFAVGELIETVGGVVSGTGLITVTVTSVDVVEFPAASRAIAVIVWVAFVSVVVSRLTWYGAVVTSDPNCTLSTRKRTPTTSTLSEACADTETVPETVAFTAG